MIIDTAIHRNDDVSYVVNSNSNSTTTSLSSSPTSQFDVNNNDRSKNNNHSTKIVPSAGDSLEPVPSIHIDGLLSNQINDNDSENSNKFHESKSNYVTQDETLHTEKQSLRLEAQDVYRYNLEWKEKFPLRYPDVINYARCTKNKVIKSCVMCKNIDGDDMCVIPSQNKDVCKICDKSFWLCTKYQVVVKFCKGCKNFTALGEFLDKPHASKCAMCRDRGRMNYFQRKRADSLNSQGFMIGHSVASGNDHHMGSSSVKTSQVEQPLDDTIATDTDNNSTISGGRTKTKSVSSSSSSSSSYNSRNAEVKAIKDGQSTVDLDRMNDLESDSGATVMHIHTMESPAMLHLQKSKKMTPVNRSLDVSQASQTLSSSVKSTVGCDAESGQIGQKIARRPYKKKKNSKSSSSIGINNDFSNKYEEGKSDQFIYHNYNNRQGETHREMDADAENAAPPPNGIAKVGDNSGNSSRSFSLAQQKAFSKAVLANSHSKGCAKKSPSSRPPSGYYGLDFDTTPAQSAVTSPFVSTVNLYTNMPEIAHTNHTKGSATSTNNNTVNYQCGNNSTSLPLRKEIPRRYCLAQHQGSHDGDSVASAGSAGSRSSSHSGLQINGRGLMLDDLAGLASQLFTPTPQGTPTTAAGTTTRSTTTTNTTLSNTNQNDSSRDGNRDGMNTGDLDKRRALMQLALACGAEHGSDTPSPACSEVSLATGNAGLSSPVIDRKSSSFSASNSPVTSSFSPFSPLKGLGLLADDGVVGDSLNNSRKNVGTHVDCNRPGNSRAPIHPASCSSYSSSRHLNHVTSNISSNVHSNSNDDKSVCSLGSASGTLSLSSVRSGYSMPPRKRPVHLAYVQDHSYSSNISTPNTAHSPSFFEVDTGSELDSDLE